MVDLKILASHPVHYVVPFLRELQQSGVEVDVAYFHEGTSLRKNLDVEFGIEIKWDLELLEGYRSRFFVEACSTYALKEQLRVLPQALRWALRDGQTPLLLFGWGIHLFWLVWMLRVLLRQPVMILGDTTPQSFAATAKPGWRVRLLRWLIGHTDACCYVGHNNRQFLKSMGAAEERLIPTLHSIDNARFARYFREQIAARTAHCARYDLDPDLPTFLFSGKLIPKKRPLALLQAYVAAGLTDQAQLIYVGEGEQRPALEAFIQQHDLQNVHLLGFLNQSEMPLAYVLGEILCLLSDATETWGLVVNEALCCGRPAIVSDAVGCVPNLINSQTGWVVPFDNQEALVRTLREAYEQHRVWPDLGQNGQALVAAHTYQSMAQSVKSMLDQMMEKEHDER